MSDQISSKLDARRDTCPRCARGSNVEELGAASGTLWLHCGFCGHLWRQLAPEADAFSLILDSRTAHARPIEEAEAAAEDGPAPRQRAAVLRQLDDAVPTPWRYRVVAGNN